MIALVVLACLASEPDVCSRNVVALSEQLPAMTCSQDLSAKAADWAVANPDMIIKDHWCMTLGSRSGQSTALVDARALPLGACEVTNRAAAVVWSYRYPGVSAIEECKRLMSQ